jgi:hypothetical protein
VAAVIRRSGEETARANGHAAERQEPAGTARQDHRRGRGGRQWLAVAAVGALCAMCGFLAGRRWTRNRRVGRFRIENRMESNP